MNNNIENNNNETVTMEMNPYLRNVKQLSDAFTFFNNKFCKGELKTPIINILPRGQKNALGWFSPERWAGGEKETATTINEICICAETLNRPVADVLETLLHEMAHLKNRLEGKADCNMQGRHNLKFKEAAEHFGLKVSKSQYKGFNVTELGEKALAAIAEYNFTGTFDIVRTKNVGNYNRPVMINVSQETKDLIVSYAKSNGLSIKSVADEAITLFIHNLVRKAQEKEAEVVATEQVTEAVNTVTEVTENQPAPVENNVEIVVPVSAPAEPVVEVAVTVEPAKATEIVKKKSSKKSKKNVEATAEVSA